MPQPNFILDPNDAPQNELAHLIRTPPDSPLKLIVTSPVPIGARTHFWGHRTIPCSAPAYCDLCAKNVRWRLHAYISALNLLDLAHVVVEFPARQYDALANWYKRTGTIRGLYLEASRPARKTNAPINLIIRKPATQPPNLPEPLDLIPILCRIWGVPPPDPTPPQPPQPPTHNNGKIPPKQPDQPHEGLREALRQALEATKIPTDP